MTTQDRIMIFSPNENGRFIKRQTDTVFQWTGDFVGEIDYLINQIPAIKGTKLFQLYPANQYVILQRYDTRTHIIELIKRIYGLNIIPYNLCIYKKKKHIMYLYVPFNEIQYSLYKTKKDEVSDSERIIFFLHWMLGVKGKAVQVYINGTGSNSIIISCGKYSTVNYSNTQLTQGAINKFFGTYHTFQNMAAKFNDITKMDQVRALMTNDNYWWFEAIQDRIISTVVPTNLPIYTQPSTNIINGNSTPPIIPGPLFATPIKNGNEFTVWNGESPIFKS
jgi:hypothetical protein